MNKCLLLLIFELMLQPVFAQPALKVYTNYSSAELVCVEAYPIENYIEVHFDKFSVTNAQKITNIKKRALFLIRSACSSNLTVRFLHGQVSIVCFIL